MDGAATTVSPNMVMKATEADLQVEVVQNTFWAPLTRDMDSTYEDSFMEGKGRKPQGILEKKTKIKEGEDNIEFGKRLALVGEGRYDGEQLLTYEEKLRNYENRAFFSDVRHGVPFLAKGKDAWTTKKFMEMEDAQNELATWMTRYYETAAWQGWILGINNKTQALHSSKVSQSLHPTIYTMESAGLSRVTWSATSNTYKTSINTARGNLATGDIFDYDRLVEAEIAMADANIKPIRVSYSTNGSKGEDECWLWVYPRTARKRIKAALRDFFVAADVRGDNNRVFKGDIVKCGKFLFMEAHYIPRLTGSSTTLTLQETWTYDATTNSRVDARADVQGVVHGLFGEGALLAAEPENLTYDFEKTDYNYRKGIGAYRMFGFRRNETYDSYSTITTVMNQSSIMLIENDA